MRVERWLIAAGFGTWLVSALPTMVRIADGRLSRDALAVFGVAFVAFGVAFGITCLERFRPWRARKLHVALLAVQTIAGLTMIPSGNDLFPAATLVVVAAQLDEFPPRVAALWVALQTIVLGIVMRDLISAVFAVATTGVFAGFQVFALATASLTVRERRAREDLARANGELLATRALLVESSRVAERLRISRDLHDTLGHHLTALSLQLDVASRLTDGKAAGHVQQAHAITRLLLSDVRDVVSQLRVGSRLDITSALRALTTRSDTLAVHLDVPDVLEIDGADHADALIKGVQEIITNTTRHADARQLWIRVESCADGITLHARDDGRGAPAFAIGHGLTGMRERFEACGGRVEFHGGDGRGFEVRGVMPRPGATA
jgi:signal transduction histidine kinase